MPEEQGSSLGLRFRLPRLTGDAAKNNESGAETPVNEKNNPAEAATDEDSNAKTAAQGKNPAMTPSPNAPNAPGAGPITPTILSQQISTQTGAITIELNRLRQEIELMQQAFVEITEQESNQSKVFDVLHKELGEYKNDFIYEHLKPVIRQLLFLYDSLEVFEEEVIPFEREEGNERRQTLSPGRVRQNVQHFRDQLIEALHICQVTLMERPEGQFDPKLHKALDVVKVPANQDNTIQRVVRQGWYLRGNIFRPAEVVVGRSNAPA